jgi:ppGpp synthetase/RelA/SpoT-type nucleotidyltranferase
MPSPFPELAAAANKKRMRSRRRRRENPSDSFGAPDEFLARSVMVHSTTPANRIRESFSRKDRRASISSSCSAKFVLSCLLLWRSASREPGGLPSSLCADAFAWIPPERRSSGGADEWQPVEFPAARFSRSRTRIQQRGRRRDEGWRQYFQQDCGNSREDDSCFVLDDADGSMYQPHFSAASTCSSPMLLACNDRYQRTSRSAPGEATDLASTTWPPWLPASSNVEDAELDDLQETIDLEFQWIRYELLKRENFGFRNVRDVSAALNRVRDAHRHDPQVVLGMVDFLRLVIFSDGLDGDDSADGGDIFGDDDDDSNALVTKDVIVASILHYVECIEARKLGLEDQIRSALFRTAPRARQVEVSSTQYGLPPGDDEALKSSDGASTELVRSLRRRNNNDLQLFASKENDAARLIARGAARIKRAEVLAHVVLHRPPRVSQSENRPLGSLLSAPLTRDEADRMRGLLLSVMDDWRSLAIRCTACLYRLEGIGNVWATNDDDDDDDDDELPDRPPLAVQTAREAMYVYAPLAEQLGMHRLKSAIEQRAFAILYRRQHRAVSSLFREKGEAMRTLNSYLLSSISALLREDEALMLQLEDLQIASRVKEPYSFWRKLLKARKKKLDRLRSSAARQSSISNVRAASTSARDQMPVPTRFVRPSLPTSDLSIADVQDGIALRVVLKARKWSEGESDDDLRARERILCYYVQHLIRKQWPEVNPSRVKDYIQNPKPNGYQSLHHTSSMSFNGVDYFPFEVQIRTDDMHRVAEFGVAAHWDYKLVGPTAASNESSASRLVPRLAPAATSLDFASSFGNPEDQSTHDSSAPTSVAVETNSTAAAVASAATGSYLDALVTAKDKVVKENVYVFLVDGTSDDPTCGHRRNRRRSSIVSLPPRAATVGDALLALNATTAASSSSFERWGFEVGTVPARRAVWKNGILADVHDKVENGDVLVVDASALSCESSSLVSYPKAGG